MCKVWNCLAVPRLRFDGATGTRLPLWDIYAETIAVYSVRSRQGPGRSTMVFASVSAATVEKPGASLRLICWTLVLPTPSSGVSLTHATKTVLSSTAPAVKQVGPPPISRGKRSGPQRPVADTSYRGRDVLPLRFQGSFTVRRRSRFPREWACA